jgi:hypothetical protein
MASLIRLKQIESGSSLEQAAEVGSDFSGAVYQIIDGAGLFSSSAQVDLVSASNYEGFVVQLDVTMSSDLERNILSASISQSVSILSQTYVTTASLNTLSSSIANTDSQSLYLINQLSSSVQATTGDFSSSVASQFSSSYATIYSISSSIDTTINNLSSSIATTISASEAGQTALSGAISTTINNLSSSIFTSLSASEAGQVALSGAISTTITNLSSSIDTTIDNLSSSINNRFIGIESVTASFESFSSSINTTILNKMNVVGVISSSAQLDGSTLRNITIAPINSDGYSLTISGALAVVNATGLPDGGFGDMDSTVPGQIYLDGNPTTASVPPPVDPSTNNQPNSNQIDMGEF